MNHFRFRLDSAVKWRHSQWKTQEAQLQDLQNRKAALESQLLALSAECARAEEEARADGGGDSLAALARYRLSCMKLSADLALRLGRLSASIETQMAAVANARRDHELLVKLEEREFQEWSTETKRRVESEASEAFLIRWNRK